MQWLKKVYTISIITSYYTWAVIHFNLQSVMTWSNSSTTRSSTSSMSLPAFTASSTRCRLASCNHNDTCSQHNNALQWPVASKNGRTCNQPVCRWQPAACWEPQSWAWYPPILTTEPPLASRFPMAGSSSGSLDHTHTHTQGIKGMHFAQILHF